MKCKQASGLSKDLIRNEHNNILGKECVAMPEIQIQKRNPLYFLPGNVFLILRQSKME